MNHKDTEFTETWGEIMRVIVSLVLSVLIATAASASPSSVWWPGWNISSSEELSGGIEYSKNTWTPQFPLSYLFDGDTKTAWVYSAKTKEFQSPFRSRYGIELKPKRAIAIDGLRLMNGQNASRARFFGNKRVVKIRVTMEAGKQKIVRTFSLSDKMGFHNVKLPRHRINSLMIEFTGLKNGNRDNGLCVSELQLINRGQKIDIKMPHAVMFYDGTEGCGASYLLRGNRMLDGIGLDDGSSDEWNAGGRYVAGANGAGGDENKAYVWIADVWRGKVVRRIHDKFSIYTWQGNRLQLSKSVNEKLVPIKFLSPPFFNS